MSKSLLEALQGCVKALEEMRQPEYCDVGTQGQTGCWWCGEPPLMEHEEDCPARIAARALADLRNAEPLERDAGLARETKSSALGQGEVYAVLRLLDAKLRPR